MLYKNWFAIVKVKITVRAYSCIDCNTIYMTVSTVTS